MKCRMPALDYLADQVLHPLRRCQQQGRHLVIQVLVTKLAWGRHNDRHFKQQKMNELPKPVESFLQAMTMAKVLALLNVPSFRTSNRNQECFFELMSVPTCTYINTGALYSQPSGKYPLVWAELHNAL